MRRITIWALSTISALVLLFSYHTSTSATAAGVVALGDAVAGSGSGTSSGSEGSGSTSSTPSQSSDGSSDAGSSGSSDSSGSTASDGTYTGEAVMTRFGAVQVEITVQDGRITESAVTQVPWSDRRDQQINSYAVPILNDETVQAQGSDIDMVSGATFTSQGYVTSLQSAIDQANL